MKGLSSEQCVKRMDHVVWKVIKGKGILLNLENGSYFEVDPVGLAVWKRCNGKTTFSKIAQAIAKEFDADLNRVIQDLEEFVGELKRQRMAELLNKSETVAVQA